MKRIHKVYVLKLRENGKVVYVGMTRLTTYRRFNEHVRRKKLERDKYLIELVNDDLSLNEAITLEEMLIEQYQTRVDGLNKAPKASNGYSNTHSEEQKRKWSEARKGIPIKGRIVRTGYRNSDKQKEAARQAQAKPIICLNNGKTYNSMREACKELNLSESKVSLVCNGKRPHTQGYKFKFFSPINSL